MLCFGPVWLLLSKTTRLFSAIRIDRVRIKFHNFTFYLFSSRSRLARYARWRSLVRTRFAHHRHARVRPATRTGQAGASHALCLRHPNPAVDPIKPAE